MAQTINVTTKSAHDLIGAGDEESLDAQDLLVENSRMRRQLATATEKERKTQEENDDLKRQVAWLQQQQEQLMTSHRRWEAEFEHAGRLASKEADVEGDEGMRSLQAGQEGYFERKAMVLASRITAIAKRSNWLQVQLESARDQAADARRRQVDAERVVTEIMQAKNPVASAEYVRSLAASGTLAGYQPPQLPTGSDIFSDDKAWAEGLPKTIPSRAARCAAMVTTALAQGQTVRSTVGRTMVSTSSSVAPTARPGNVWATLMNGGAAGAKVDFA